MTVIELMAELSCLGESEEVLICTDHGQSPETVTSVSEDYVLDPNGDLVHLDDLKDDGHDLGDCESVVVIWGN